MISETTAYRRPRGGRPPPAPETHPNRALRNLLAFTSRWPAVKGARLDEDDKLLKTATRFAAWQVGLKFQEDLAGVIGRVEGMARSAERLSTALASLLQQLRGGRGATMKGKRTNAS